MPFRKDRGTGPASDGWRKKNISNLLAAGIPEVIASNQKNWTYTLFHGAHPSVGWNLTWISEEEARQLYALLKESGEGEVGYSLMDDLRRRFEEGN